MEKRFYIGNIVHYPFRNNIQRIIKVLNSGKYYITEGLFFGHGNISLQANIDLQIFKDPNTGKNFIIN